MKRQTRILLVLCEKHVVFCMIFVRSALFRINQAIFVLSRVKAAMLDDINIIFAQTSG